MSQLNKSMRIMRNKLLIAKLPEEEKQNGLILKTESNLNAHKAKIVLLGDNVEHLHEGMTVIYNHNMVHPIHKAYIPEEYQDKECFIVNKGAIKRIL